MTSLAITGAMRHTLPGRSAAGRVQTNPFFPALLWAINGARLDPKPDVEVMTQAEFDALPSYSCSLPTGTIVGKRWRRGHPYANPTHWWLGEYIEHPDPGYVGVRWRLIEVARDVRDEPFVGYTPTAEHGKGQRG